MPDILFKQLAKIQKENCFDEESLSRIQRKRIFGSLWCLTKCMYFIKLIDPSLSKAFFMLE